MSIAKGTREVGLVFIKIIRSIKKVNQKNKKKMLTLVHEKVKHGIIKK